MSEGDVKTTALGSPGEAGALAALAAAGAKADGDKTGVDPNAQKPTDPTPEQKLQKDFDEFKKGHTAPEKYEDFKLPDGIVADKADLEGFQGIAKEIGLTQANAQKLIDYQAGLVKKANEGLQKAWDDIRSGWVKEAEADAEIGGANKDKALTDARAAIKAFGTPKLIEALDQTGTGDHPEFIRFCAKIGRLIGEDKLHLGGAAGAKKSPEDRLFNHPTS